MTSPDSEDSAAVDPEDAVPSSDAQDIDVWFTEWQVAEDGLDLSVGQQLSWALVPMDQDWATRLFAGRRSIPLQLDTYAAATRDVADPSAWIRLAGRVARIDQVSVRYHPSEDPAEPGLVPETGGAMQHSVVSLRNRRAHHGKIVGWVVRVRR